MSRTVANARWRGKRPALSVLIPFYRDDPCDLLRDLNDEAGQVGRSVEVIVLSDGGGDADLVARVEAAIKAMALPARLIDLKNNEGRVKGPQPPGRRRPRAAASCFWTATCGRTIAAFCRPGPIWRPGRIPPWPSAASPCCRRPTSPASPSTGPWRPAPNACPYQERARQPEKYVYTSNLLVRRDVFEAEAFDSAFTGWGWEDVEWAMRVSRRFRVVHIDNPATHMGLDTAGALAAKYEQSAPNFARVVARHPDIVSTYPSYKAARLLKRAPGMNLARPLLKTVAMTDWLPAGTRAFSLRLYRAALYAEAV